MARPLDASTGPVARDVQVGDDDPGANPRPGTIRHRWPTPEALRIHPQTQGKIERYHRSMKKVVELQHDYFPWELEAALRDFFAYDNNERYHEAIGNVTPADIYFGRQFEVLMERSKIKRRTMERRKKEYLAQKAA